MKLIFCKSCQDVVRLTGHLRKCQCGECWGVYTDGLYAKVSESSVVLGFSNPSFVRALHNPPTDPDGPGKRFEAFVIPDGCKTVKKE